MLYKVQMIYVAFEYFTKKNDNFLVQLRKISTYWRILSRSMFSPYFRIAVLDLQHCGIIGEI